MLNIRPSILFPALFLIVGGSIALWWFAGVHSTKPVIVESPPVEAEPSGAAPLSAFQVDAAALRKAAAITDTPQAEQASRATLLQMMERLWRVPPAQLAAIVRAYLEGGEDAPTGLSFDVGTDGSITDPSSMRVALFDLLARLAPEHAIPLGREWLQKTNSQDEWAAALRCAALEHEAGDPAAADQTFLVEQVSRRLRQQDWIAQPSAGFLHAFDAASLLNDPRIYEDLASIHQQATASLAAREAASLALREAAQNSPGTFTSYLLENPAFLVETPALRGTLLASADVRTPERQVALAGYLVRGPLPAEEIQAFLAQFPQTIWTSGLRLLSSSIDPAIPAGDKPAQYAGAIAVFDSIAPSLAARSPESSAYLTKRKSITQERLAQAIAGATP